MFFEHLIFYLDHDHTWQLAGAFDEEYYASYFWHNILIQYPGRVFKWIYFDRALGVVRATNAPKRVDHD